MKFGRHDTSLYANIAAALDGIKKESFNSALMQDDLLESTYSGNGIWYSVTSTNDAIAVGVPETYFQHMI